MWPTSWLINFIFMKTRNIHNSSFYIIFNNVSMIITKTEWKMATFCKKWMIFLFKKLVIMCIDEEQYRVYYLLKERSEKIFIDSDPFWKTVLNKLLTEYEMYIICRPPYPSNRRKELKLRIKITLKLTGHSKKIRSVSHHYMLDIYSIRENFVCKSIPWQSRYNRADMCTI